MDSFITLLNLLLSGLERNLYAALPNVQYPFLN